MQGGGRLRLAREASEVGSRVTHASNAPWCRRRLRYATKDVPPGRIQRLFGFAGLALSAVVVATRERLLAGQESIAPSYDSSSRQTVQVLAQGIRDHWGIANRWYWVLEVVFGADRNRTCTGKAAENLVWLRRVALSLLRQDQGEGSSKRKRKRAARSNTYREQLLVSMSQM